MKQMIMYIGIFIHKNKNIVYLYFTSPNFYDVIFAKRASYSFHQIRLAKAYYYLVNLRKLDIVFKVVLVVKYHKYNVSNLMCVCLYVCDFMCVSLCVCVCARV